MVIIALILAANVDRLATGGLSVFLVVILHNLCGLALGYLIAFALCLAEPKRRALCIEVGMQNSGLAASLAAARREVTGFLAAHLPARNWLPGQS